MTTTTSTSANSKNQEQLKEINDNEFNKNGKKK
jgi:hypothetical protein